MYWWIRLIVRLVVFFTILALALTVFELAVWFLLGIFAGYLLLKTMNRQRHYASKDQHYE